MKISETMTTSVETCGPDASGADLARIMWDRDVGCVPIVDSDRRPIGMVTDRDLCMAAYTRGQPLHDIVASSVMSSSLRSCRPTDSLVEAERLMAAAAVRRLPVVGDEGRIVGVVSLGDIARARSRTAQGRATEHVFADVAMTLAVISEPRRPAAGAPADLAPQSGLGTA
jgi:CBS domain-containing protein